MGFILFFAISLRQEKRDNYLITQQYFLQLNVSWNLQGTDILALIYQSRGVPGVYTTELRLLGLAARLLVFNSIHNYYPVGWGFRIHRLHPWGGVNLHNECPGYDTKQFDDKVLVILELWGMRSNPSLSSLPGPLRPGVVAYDRVLSMDQIELNCLVMLNRIAWSKTVLIFKLHTYTKLNCLK